jgi:ATP-binding cassette subfamily F protein 3
MIEISLNNIKKNYGFKNVLDGLNLEIQTGDRIAIVGNNGAGKTTLFKIIMGIESYNEGTVSLKKGSTLGFLEQVQPNYDKDIIVKDILMQAFLELTEIEKELNVLEIKMANYLEDTNKLMKRYGELQTYFISKDGYNIDLNISKMCSVFKITEDMLYKKFSSLSGGQTTVVHLASLLLSKPDVLLLDEPTNHLDISMIEWLEEFLKNYDGTVIISSHDRFFLDKVVKKIIFLDNGKGSIYHGNYSYFVQEQERELISEFQNYKTQQKQIQAMNEAIKRYADWGNRSGNEKFFKAAANLQKRIDRIKIIDKPQAQNTKLPLIFSQNDRSGKDVVNIKDVSISFTEKTVLKMINFKINYGEKVCIIGKNGSGKTTLIKILLGQLTNYSGEVKIGSNVKIGYLSQQICFEDEKKTVIDEFRKHFNGTETSLRAALAKFYFNGENVFKRIDKLSGGEKVRLKLAELIQSDVNFLVLDEPTNHIDIYTKETLEDSLLEFKGTILFVSHDRYFINKLASRVVEIEDGKLITYLGNYDYYKQKKN